MTAESLFRTVKYRPEFPAKGFAELDDARAWAVNYRTPNFNWLSYNFGGQWLQCGKVAHAPAMREQLKQAVIEDGNVFAVLVDAVKYCSLGQISSELYEVGGQYRRSM